jgi:hypothetical protein
MEAVASNNWNLLESLATHIKTGLVPLTEPFSLPLITYSLQCNSVNTSTSHYSKHPPSSINHTTHFPHTEISSWRQLLASIWVPRTRAWVSSVMIESRLS